MSAGRKPKPTKLKELEGNPGKRPLNKNEPQYSGVPTAPKHLDKAAKQEWKRISKDLESAGVLTTVDRAALAAYCAAYSRWAAAETNIQKFGMVIKAPSGYPIQNPYVTIANTAMGNMHKFATEFGLTPSSRSRIQVEPQKTDPDPFAEFMKSIGANEIDAEELRRDSDDVLPSSSREEDSSE